MTDTEDNTEDVAQEDDEHMPRMVPVPNAENLPWFLRMVALGRIDASQDMIDAELRRWSGISRECPMDNMNDALKIELD